MGGIRRPQQLQSLLRETRRREFAELWIQLRRHDGTVRGFGCWSELASSSNATSDRVLACIFELKSSDPDPRWSTILLLLFHRRLIAVHGILVSRIGWSPELWNELQWAFLRRISQFDLLERPSQIAKKILNDACHDVREAQVRERADDWVRWPSNEEGDDIDFADWDRGHESVESGLDDRWRERRLNRLRNREQLSEEDYYLLMGTEIYQRSLGECAEELGISYEKAKKRRQRALARHQRHNLEAEDFQK